MPDIFRGVVTKVGAMSKTITVTVSRRFEHPKYIKQILRTKKMLVHDELAEARLGDQVTITHTRPLSKTKHFYLSAINQRRLEPSTSAAIPNTSSSSSALPASSFDPSPSSFSGSNVQRHIPLKAGPPTIPKAKTVSQARKRELSGKQSGWDVSVINRIDTQEGASVR